MLIFSTFVCKNLKELVLNIKAYSNRQFCPRQLAVKLKLKRQQTAERDENPVDLIVSIYYLIS